MKKYTCPVFPRGKTLQPELAGDVLIACGMVFRIIQAPAITAMTELMITDGPNDHPGWGGALYLERGKSGLDSHQQPSLEFQATSESGPISKN